MPDQPAPEGPVRLSDIRERINIAERFMAEISPGDEYLEAIARNQVTLLQMLSNQGRMSGGIIDDSGGDGGFLSDPERSALPEDATGTVARDINPRDNGPAIFQLQGSVFYTIVQNTDKVELQAGTAVRCIGENNQVTARGAAANIAGAGAGVQGDYFRYQGRLYKIPRVTEGEEDVKVANQIYTRGTREDVGSDLGPGQEKEFARIEPDANQFALLKHTNATAHDTVGYRYHIDDPENRDQDLSGTVPWATPPNFYEVSPGGFKLVEDFVSLELAETSGSNSYSNVQGTLTGLLLEVQA